MAESPPHKFGQIVGNLLEDIMRPILQEFCDTRKLYLDIQGERYRARSGKKVTWLDKYGNTHNLDFVIEKGGSKDRIGRPVAFIEAAWRRYTKHSKNKVQEIQSAVLPIADKFNWDKPFLGAVLAGEFTQGSLDQLASVGFKVLYFPYEHIVSAFANVDVNVRFDESTADEDFRKCIKSIEDLDEVSYDKLKSSLGESGSKLLSDFLSELSLHLDRMLEKLIVIPLFGEEQQFENFLDAKNFIENFVDSSRGGSFRKYEVIAKYSNGDFIDASFDSKLETIKFLDYLAS